MVTAVGSSDIARRNSVGEGALIWGRYVRRAESMMPPVLRRFSLPTFLVAASLGLAACGTSGIEVAEDDSTYDGAVLFAERCSGCHTMKSAGAQGSANRALRNQGPNLDQRVETVDDVLFAIRNGGFSGAIMPQNIVVGEEAEAVAEFVAEYSGTSIDRPPKPGETPAGG
jgi:mono/diheme cytochrome c family protein